MLYTDIITHSLPYHRVRRELQRPNPLYTWLLSSIHIYKPSSPIHPIPPPHLLLPPNLISSSFQDQSHPQNPSPYPIPLPLPLPGPPLLPLPPPPLLVGCLTLRVSASSRAISLAVASRVSRIAFSVDDLAFPERERLGTELLLLEAEAEADDVNAVRGWLFSGNEEGEGF